MTSRFTILFRTERLIIRTATVEDADLLYTLWTNPQVMAHVGFPQGLPITENELKDRLSKQGGAVFEQLLVFELTSTGQAIGECYLSHSNEGIVEPDVKLLPAFWGHGYGTEVWKGLIGYAFIHTDCVLVQGTPNVENVASIRMQESAGGVCVGEDVYQFPDSMSEYTTPVHHYVYQVHRTDWQRHHGAQEENKSR